MKLKHYTYMLALALAVMMTACSSDDEQWTAPDKDAVRLTLPIELRMSQPLADGTRAAIGDPGYDDRLDPPTILYVFSWIQEPGANTYSAQYFKREVAATDWVYNATDNYYRLSKDIELKYNVDIQAYTDGQRVGFTYVVATNKAFTDTQLQAIATTASANETGVVIWDSDAKPTFTDAVVEFNYDEWKSDHFRDLYSNPANDPVKDARDALNGEILYQHNTTPTDEHPEHELVMGNIRLYHVAAKYDFTWEVADKELQKTTAVNTITVTGLPTQCKIFEPANNPDGTAIETASTEPIKTDIGSQWIGRGVVYGLQRADASLPYTVTFKDVDGLDTTPTKADVSTTFTLPTGVTKNALFTGWYRVIAEVNPPAESD